MPRGVYPRKPKKTANGKVSKATGAVKIDTPAVVIAAARDLSGWALGYHKTEQMPGGALVVTVRLSHRGALTVPHTPFKSLPGYCTRRVHSYVSGQKAFVWLTLRPE